MNRINNAITEFGKLESLARRDQWVNHIYPLVSLGLTVLYIAITVSFGKYDLFGLAGMAVYPLALFILADLRLKECLYRLRVVLPLVLVIGLFNPLLDKTPVLLGSRVIRGGWISMITLMMKGVFSVLASYILVATTPVEHLCYALRRIHVPQILVTQLLLTYRYISVLLDEAHRLTQAYSLRAPGQKGVHFKVWGSLAGQLLLHSMDRAQTVYESMLLRGFDGNFRMGRSGRFRAEDAAYGLFWTLLFLLFRRYAVILLIGNLFV